MLETIKSASVEITDEQYFNDCYSGEYLTSHMLAKFRRAPIFYKEALGQRGEDKPEYIFGRAVHAYILQGPEVFERNFVVGDGPINEKTGKPFGPTSQAYQKWAACVPGTPVSTEDFRVIQAMAESCKLWGNVLKPDNLSEVCLRGEICGVKCQAKIDSIASDGTIVDVKSCNSLDKFIMDINEYDYGYQLAFYKLMEEAKGIKVDPKGYLIAVEKVAPYRAGAFFFGNVLNRYCEQVKQEIARFKVCRERNSWPTGFESAVLIDDDRVISTPTGLFVKRA